ncbi:glycosyltransferase family 4 protein [Gordonia polyisoprenivorans]|uniref:glycosyltransferase family 4 protein n=1 Tax=Gordonia polyisoprenivorans TaxID=84595 RepID=UPI0013FE05E5|nr:glycosyltransferase family 4 protein [Gordonia polyisoprenivorans]
MTAEESRLYADSRDRTVGAGYEVVRIKPFESKIRWRFVRKAISSLGLSYAFAITRQYVRRQPDVVVLEFVRPHGLAALWIKYVLRVPVVLCLVGRTDVASRMSPAMRAHYRLTLLGIDLVIQNSEYYTARSKVDFECLTIPYGVNMEVYGLGSPGANVSIATADARRRIRERHGLAPACKVVLAVQRLDKLKRVDKVVEAFRLVNHNNRDIESALLIVGKGPEYTRIAKIIEASSADNVIMCGFVPDQEIADYFLGSDVFASHSMNETFGVTFAEAMAAGLPIVAARTSCIPWVLDTDFASIVEPFDIPAFASAVSEILADEQLARRMGETARRSAICYDWRSIAAEYSRALRKACHV